MPITLFSAYKDFPHPRLLLDHPQSYAYVNNLIRHVQSEQYLSNKDYKPPNAWRNGCDQHD